MTRKPTTPGDRLRAVIEEMGGTFEDFGASVAENESPPRDRPYGRNHVWLWLKNQRSPSTKAWLAIERVTGKPMEHFLAPPPTRTKETERPRVRPSAKKQPKDADA